VKEASSLLAASNLNYIGYVEGDDIFLGSVDVVVCDGFIGNVMLKTTEGAAKMITGFMKDEFKANIFSKLAAMLSIPALKRFKKRVDPREYNGASLLGLQGIVVKSHGSADAYSFCNAIHVAMLEVEKDVPALISHKLESQLIMRQAN
jgi:glycerol-3-phosphate acyltransferase PlsX